MPKHTRALTELHEILSSLQSFYPAVSLVSALNLLFTEAKTFFILYISPTLERRSPRANC